MSPAKVRKDEDMSSQSESSSRDKVRKGQDSRHRGQDPNQPVE